MGWNNCRFFIRYNCYNPWEITDTPQIADWSEGERVTEYGGIYGCTGEDCNPYELHDYKFYSCAPL